MNEVNEKCACCVENEEELRVCGPEHRNVIVADVCPECGAEWGME